MRTTHLIGLLALGGAVAGMGFGCSSDPANDDGAGGSATTGTGGMTASTNTGPGPGSTVSSTGSGMMDESTSCADAVAMEALENQAGGTFYQGLGVINPAEDADFFTFTAQTGDWIWLATDANPNDDPEMIDTVITLYNEDGSTQLAQVDDAFPRITTDSEMFYRVETGGTFCLKVEEFSDWAGQTPEGDPSFSYRALAIPVDFALYDQFNEDAEPNDTLGAPQTLASFTVSDTTNQIFTQIAGDFSADTDVDVFQFTAPTGALGMAIDFTPKGIDGFGSTDLPGIINIYDSTDTRIATLDVTNGSDGFSSVPIMAGADYKIEVAKESGAAGSNPFYFLKFGTASVLNEQEANEVANNSAMTPDTVMATPNGDTTSYFLGGELPANDVDWWSIPNVQQGQSIAVVCSSQRVGSGVGAFQVNYHGTNAGMPATQTETETATTDILWSDAPLPNVSMPAISNAEAGTHFFRITSAMDIPDVASKHYLCGIHVSTP